jgi:hypothetical protein
MSFAAADAEDALGGQSEGLVGLRQGTSGAAVDAA